MTAQETFNEGILRGLLAVAKCPNCDGSGAYQEERGSRQYVSRDMAHDAGDLSLEGQLYSDVEVEVVQCQWCAERDEILNPKNQTQT